MAMRNPNGYGAVFKLHGKRRKPWAVVKTLSINTGKQKRVLLGTFETRAEANDFLVEYNRNPYDLKTKNISFLEVYNAFCEYQKNKVKEKTFSNYKTSFKFFEKISNFSMRELKLYDFQKLFDESELAYGSLANRKAFATSIYDFAIKRELLDKNIASHIEINTTNKVVRTRNIFTNEEINDLWKIYSNNDKKNKQTVACLLLMIYTSLRIGELLGLKKENLDMNSEIKVINVVESKTKAGIRIIPLHSKIIPVVEELLKDNISEFLVTSPRGKMYTYNYWLKYRLDSFSKENNMVHTSHDCRHTFITLMTAAGADPVVLRQIVGHEGKDVTEKVYTHLPIEVLKANIDLLS